MGCAIPDCIAARETCLRRKQVFKSTLDMSCCSGHATCTYAQAGSEGTCPGSYPCAGYGLLHSEADLEGRAQETGGLN